MIQSIQYLIAKIKLKRTARQRYKSYNKMHQTPYDLPYRNQGYYE